MTIDAAFKNICASTVKLVLAIVLGSWGFSSVLSVIMPSKSYKLVEIGTIAPI